MPTKNAYQTGGVATQPTIVVITAMNWIVPIRIHPHRAINHQMLVFAVIITINATLASVSTRVGCAMDKKIVQMVMMKVTVGRLQSVQRQSLSVELIAVVFR